MFKNNFIYAGILLLFGTFSLIGCGGAGTQKSETGNIEWPEITKETRPWTRWWWHGSAVNEKDITALLETYQKSGLGGMEITAIYGVRGREDQFIEYLSPKWVDKFVYTLEEAKRLGLGIDLANASGWPFGGPWISDEDATKSLVSKEFRLQGGQKLTEPVEYIQQPFVSSVLGNLPPEIKEPVTANDFTKYAFTGIRYKKSLPIIAVTANKAVENGFGETIDVTDKVVNRNLDWTAPEGEWVIIALFLGDEGMMVKRAGPGGEGHVMNHFSEKVTKVFLSKFDEAFKGRDISYLRHYFNDSYEVSGDHNWTPEFFDEFKQFHGYDLKNHLPALLGLDTEEMNKRVLYDYRMALSNLLLERFTKTWQQWASRQGKGVRNQAGGSPGNIFDLWEAVDIPEIEGDDPVLLKSASSVAHVTGKKLTSSESATWLNDHFLTTLEATKESIDKFLLAGVNHILYHGTAYSPQDAPWPGWLFYAAAHYEPTNSWWTDFGAFNQYVARAQSFLQSGRPSNDCLVYFGVGDWWSQLAPERPGRVSRIKPQPQRLSHRDVFNYPSMRVCVDYLTHQGYSWDAISDRQLMNVSFEKPSLNAGGNHYKTVIVPATHNMPAGTFEKLVNLANDGATILFCNELPADVPGLTRLEEYRKKLNSLKEKLSFTENGNLRTAKYGKGKIIISDDLSALMAISGVTPESMYTSELQCIRRIKNDGNFYYFIKNPAENNFEGWIELNVKYNSAAIYNPMTGVDGYAKTRKNNGKTEVYVQMKPQETLAIETLTGNYSGSMYPFYQTSGMPVTLSGDWTVEFAKGGPTLPQKLSSVNLGSWTDYGGEYAAFSGTADYIIKIPALTATPDAWRLELGKVNESAAVYVNERYAGTLINSPYTLEIPAHMLKTGDELKISVSNLMANRIADMDKRGVEYRIFYNTNVNSGGNMYGRTGGAVARNVGPDGRFSAKNWNPKDSGLSGPVTLTPLDEMK